MPVNIGTLEGLIRLKDEFTAKLDKVTSQLKQTGEQWEKVGRQMSNVGEGLTKAVTVPLAGLAAASVKAAMDFESSFAGIIKTVDGVQDEFGNLTEFGKELQQGMRDLAKEIPINVNELNRVAEAAGQLGIAKEDILGFTRVMADLGQTTNLTADEAATATAQFQNIFGAAGKEVDRFGATLVALGNAGASTEKDVINMGLRIAGAGVQIGLSQGEVMAFANALASMGIEAEAGGSAISKVMIDMALAVETGGSALHNFEEVARSALPAGQSFAETFERDAAGAVRAFIEGLGNIKESGGSVLKVLDDMGVTEIRMRDALLRSAGAGDLLADSLDLQARAWKENSALTDEAAKRYQTFQSQLTLTWNRVKDVAITFGTSLLPALRDVLDATVPLIEKLAALARWFAALPPGAQKVILVIGGIAAAIGPLLVVLGQLAIAWGAVIGAAPGVVTAFGMIKTAALGLPGVLVAVGVAINVLINKWKDALDRALVDMAHFQDRAAEFIDIRKQLARGIRAGEIDVTVLQRNAEMIGELKKNIGELEGRLPDLQKKVSKWGSAVAREDARALEDLTKNIEQQKLRLKDLEALANKTRELRKTFPEDKAAAEAEAAAASAAEATAKEVERLKKSLADLGVDIITEDMEDAADASADLAKELAKVRAEAVKNARQNRELSVAMRGGATKQEIDDLKRKHALENAYLQDVEQFGKKAADALKGLRLEEQKSAEQMEKTAKAWEQAKKHIAFITDPATKMFENDRGLENLTKGLSLTSEMATQEERRTAAIAEAKRLFDLHAISAETYRRVLQENATWIEAGETSWEKQLRYITHITSEIGGWASVLEGVFRGVDDDLADMLKSVAQIADAWQQALSAKTTAEAAGAGAAMGQGVFGMGQSAGLWQGNRGRGAFGAQLSGDYADVGAQVGGIIGAVIGSFIGPAGTAIGAMLGSLIGGLIGGAIKKGADEGLGKLQEIGGEISVAIRRSEGGLGGVISEIASDINDAVNGILNALGGELQSIGDNVWLKVRDDIITVTVGNLKRRFEEMDDAISFAVAEILKQSEITGLSDTMRTVIENSAAESVEQLISDIEFGQWYERLGFEQIVGHIRDALIAFRAAMKKATDLGLDIEPITQDFIRSMGRMRDQLLGIQIDPEEQLKRDIDAWNQELKLIDAEQAVREADLSIRKAELQAKIALFDGFSTLADQELQMRMAMLDAEYQIVGSQGDLLASLLEAMEAVDAALETVRGIRDGMAGLGISDEEREEALRRLRNQQGGGGGADPRQGVRDFIDNRTFELATRGMSDYRRELAELSRQYDDLLEQAGRDNTLREKLIALREREIELMRQEHIRDIVDAFQDFLGLANPFNEVRERAAGLIADILDTFGMSERSARMIGRVMGEVERQLNRIAAEMAVGLLGSLLQDLEAFGASEQQMFEIRKSIAIIEHNLRMAHYAAQIAILKAEGRIAPEIIRQMEDAYNFLAGIDPTLILSGAIVQRQLSPKEFRDAVERDRAMVNGGDAANDLADALKRAKDLLGKYQEDGLDPFTRTLRRINEDFKLIRTAMGSTAEVMAAYNRAVANAMADLLDPIRQVQRDLFMGDLSPADTLDQWALAQKDFVDLQARFAGGDLSSIGEIPTAVQEMLRLAREVTPVGSEEYKRIFTDANRFLNEVLALTPDKIGTTGNPMAVAGMSDLAALSEAQVDRLDRIHTSSERVAAAVEAMNTKLNAGGGVRFADSSMAA